MMKIRKRLIASIASIVLLCTSIPGFAKNANEIFEEKANMITNLTGLSENIEDGAIFHAFSWPLETIKENVKLIANAGFTSIQTSPLSESVGVGTPLKYMGENNSDGSEGAWWWLYQPTNQKIGNFQMGTREDLVELCSEADRYGVKIIVDVVANHTTFQKDKVAKEMIEAANNELYHDTGFEQIQKWDDRLQVTRYQMSGLWDVDTENKGYQDYLISYLNDCIDCGVDGFRYDMAKHIGLPDDQRPNGVKNNFWTRVTNDINKSNDIFHYGEVLQGDNDRINDYINVIGSATASQYGYVLRENIDNNNLSTDNLLNFTGIDNQNNVDFVTWVESHDNYAHDSTVEFIDNTEVKLAWAAIAARKSGTPLFFSRPMNAAKDNKWGNNIIGEAGDDFYRDDEIAAVNYFRNCMVDESEYLRNLEDNTSVLIIERGKKGAVIINASESEIQVNTNTTLLNGKYASWTSDNSKFEVLNNKLLGSVPPKSVRVLMPEGIKNPQLDPSLNVDIPIIINGKEMFQGEPTEKYTIYYPENWETTNIHYCLESSNWTANPGLKMQSSNIDGYVKINIKAYENQKLTACFNNGTDWDSNGNLNYVFNEPGVYNVINGNIFNGIPNGKIPSNNTAKIYYKTSWEEANMHYQIGSCGWTKAPGIVMEDSDIEGYKVINIDLGTQTKVTGCFNNGTDWDSNNGENYLFNGSEIYTVVDGEITAGKPVC